MKWLYAAVATLIVAIAASLHAQQPRLREDASARQARDEGSGAAYFIRGLEDPRDRLEARADILDTPVLPGSTVKMVALVAALEKGIITPTTSHMCRRVVK